MILHNNFFTLNCFPKDLDDVFISFIYVFLLSPFWAQHTYPKTQRIAMSILQSKEHLCLNWCISIVNSLRENKNRGRN